MPRQGETISSLQSPRSDSGGADMTDMTVYVVSNDRSVRDALAELTACDALQIETFRSLAGWLERMPAPLRGCLVLDARPADLTDPARLALLSAACVRLPVVVMVDRGDVPAAVSAIRAGVLDVVEKPSRNANLLERVRGAIAASQRVCV